MSGFGTSRHFLHDLVAIGVMADIGPMKSRIWIWCALPIRAEVGLILPIGQLNDSAVQLPPKKIIPLVPSGKSVVALRASRLTRGAYRDRHERWVRDAMDVMAPPDERRYRGRRSRVVLTSRR
jgi:hypothetical protein